MHPFTLSLTFTHSPFLPVFDNMALHSFNSSEEQFQASRIMFKNQYSADEFSSFRYSALALANPSFYTYLILRCSFFCRLFLVFFSLFVSLSFLVDHMLSAIYIPPLFAALSPFSTEFIHALHCFQSIVHLNTFFYDASFVRQDTSQNQRYKWPRTPRGSSDN